MKAILYAFLAAVFYAINIPASKILLRDVGPTTMAALLKEGLSWIYLAALAVMVAGAALVVIDTFARQNMIQGQARTPDTGDTDTSLLFWEFTQKRYLGPARMKTSFWRHARIHMFISGWPQSP